MKWITRKGVRLDRSAIAWLIRRYIDAEAEFVYAPSERVMALAHELGAVPFHHPDAELKHTGSRTGFDAFLFKYHLLEKDPALALMALVIRGGETTDRHLTPYSAGLKALSNGIRAQYGGDDAAIVEAHAPLLDALYWFCQSQLRPTKDGGGA
jgi:hypothetical protein